MKLNIVEKYFEVEVCDYTPEDLQKIRNRLNEINENIEVTELVNYSVNDKLRLHVTYLEEADKNEMEQTIADTFQFSDLWHKCIISK